MTNIRITCVSADVQKNLRPSGKEEENPGEWLKDLIQVMAYQELCNRRREYRNFKRKFINEQGPDLWDKVGSDSLDLQEGRCVWSQK